MKFKIDEKYKQINEKYNIHFLEKKEK